MYFLLKLVIFHYHIYIMIVFFRGVDFIFREDDLSVVLLVCCFSENTLFAYAIGRCIKVYPMLNLRNVHPCGLT